MMARSEPVDKRVVEEQVDRLRAAAFEMLDMADKIAAASQLPYASMASSSRADTNPSGLTLLQAALDTYRIRRSRDKYFPSAIFGEPAWDILLDLYANETLGRKVTVSNVCVAAAAPMSTGMRWLRMLEDRGFITREAADDDNRVIFVRLTDLARKRLEAYFSVELSAAPNPASAQ